VQWIKSSGVGIGGKYTIHMQLAKNIYHYMCTVKAGPNFRVMKKAAKGRLGASPCIRGWTD
jgi:hypothetical protein